MRGSPIKYSDAELKWVKSNCTLSRIELHQKFCSRFDRSDVTIDNLKALCTRNSWTTGDAGKSRKKGRSDLFSEKEIAWMKAHATDDRVEAHARFCKKFKRPEITLAQYRAYCKRNKILTGRTGHFEAGHVPWSKGKKLPSNENSKRHQFKKGQLPHNTKGPGHVSICPIDGYKYLIVAQVNKHTGGKTSRVLMHKWLWEEKNGPVPEGMCLKCLDGNRLNTDPENWEAIPRGVLARLSSRTGRGYDHAPDELKPTIMVSAKLAHAADQALKGSKK